MTEKFDAARRTFEAMPLADRENLAKLNYWLDPDYKRKRGEHLFGHEYYALIDRGVASFGYVDAERGREIKITDLGRAVLHYVQSGP